MNEHAYQIKHTIDTITATYDTTTNVCQKISTLEQ